jgi:hypothetical protein
MTRASQKRSYNRKNHLGNSPSTENKPIGWWALEAGWHRCGRPGGPSLPAFAEAAAGKPTTVSESIRVPSRRRGGQASAVETPELFSAPSWSVRMMMLEDVRTLKTMCQH